MAERGQARVGSAPLQVAAHEGTRIRLLAREALDVGPRRPRVTGPTEPRQGHEPGDGREAK